MADDPRARDDNQMQRFDQEGLNRFSARQSVIAITITTLLLILFSGASVRHAGEEMKPGIGRDMVLAFGKPAGWLADRLPLNDVANRLTAVVAADDGLTGAGFDQPISQQPAGRVPPVTPESFDPLELGQKVRKQQLGTLLVTGDSLSTPLDLELARRLAPAGVDVIREPHLATGISNDTLADWGKLSATQVDEHHPDAVVVFIGANEGYPIPGLDGGKEVSCCSPEWAAVFANRARQMMDTYRQAGAARVYWLTVPTPRDPDRQEIERTVNEAIAVAAQPWRDQIHLIDTVATFTPGDRYRDSMEIDGAEKIVRESDGIHLNETGSSLAADLVIQDIEREFDY
ncbi:MAG: GDSL-type esterase/lipase family protein [Actinomycetota bacterium]